MIAVTKKEWPLLPVLGLLLTAGCASWLWSRSNPAPRPDHSPERPSPAADLPAQARVALPEAPAERRKAALFYSDLGPDTIDVSAYPAQRRRDYEVYARACSRCHTLARSINAPYVDRGWWDFYIAKMRMRSRRRGESLDAREVGAILDFLEYDSNERKVARAAEFDAIKLELKRRFADALDARVKELGDQNLPAPQAAP